MQRNSFGKFQITTFGCQMNEHDSEIMAGLLSEMGYTETQDRDHANLVIFNTCSIRENADKRFFGTLGQLKKNKMARGDEYIVCVCGCMMQQEQFIETIEKKYPWVDIIFGTHNIENLPKLLEKRMNTGEKQREILEDRTRICEGLPAKRKYRHKSYVNITFGCNNFCTYCIVPYTRGREKSREAGDIVQEIKNLVKDGVKEVMLLGQNVNSYKSATGEDFADLINAINEINGLERIRFMTSHPKDLSDKLIKAYGDCNKLCKNIHLPVQSGSDEILEKMNRKYTSKSYMKLVEKIREVCPSVTISTDIIVGFPGETEEDFQKTLDLIENVEYDSAFTFMYSPRKGTPAAKYHEQIDEEVQHERFQRLVDLVNNISEKKNSKYVGMVEKVLVEGRSKNNPTKLEGRTDGFKLVHFEGTDDIIGQIVSVKIVGSNTFSLEGELFDK